LIVDDLVIVELKSVRQLIEAHEVQLVNYLTATGKPVGLLINFGTDGVTVRRKVRELPLSRSPAINPVHPVNPV
jgi:GxxExxY protein